jgi:DegV family protein with EDD domain
MVRIVTDSLSDITPEFAKELGIDVVPLNVHFGKDETYQDYIELSVDDFYKKLVTSDVHPSTSAPPPGIFLELFTRLSKETNEILAIMASNKLSAVCESAVQGKALMESDCRIEVINSEQLIGGQAMLVFKALDAAKSGANLDQISDLIRKSIPKLHIRMAFDTLEYLQKGGRIGKAQAFLGGLLKIHPVLGLKDGEIVPISRARSRAQAVDFLVNFVKDFPKVEQIVVEHATTPDELDALVDKLSEILPRESILKSRVGAVIGVHAGPHVLAVSVLEA